MIKVELGFVPIYAQSARRASTEKTESNRGRPPHQRICVACRQFRSKQDLLRICRAADGTGIFVFEDPLNDAMSRRIHGRSAYVCRDSMTCFTKVSVKNRLSGALRTKVPPEVYEKCAQLIQTSMKEAAEKE
ncbi:hypothetical protein CCYA_CCYA03G0942 [Cyanidiococcus yangmingshanensis]|nr:hypothetical protein CCYA_CCYA03G0942 [Cyanidiococcus yangmingshanensis]